MVTLEQIRQLDARVRRAIELISKLREENYTLKNRLAEYQDRIEELEVLISNFKEDQSEIEQGIVSVISELDHLDEGPKAAPAAARPSPVEAQTPAARPREQRTHSGGTAPAAPHPRPTADPHPTGNAAQNKDQEAEDAESAKPEAELDIF